MAGLLPGVRTFGPVIQLLRVFMHSFEPKASYTREELITCGNGQMFGPGNAQLPVPNMLMLDRIAHISQVGGEFGKGEIVAELDINPELWFFQCHFPGDPVMPGCLGLDAMWQLVGFSLPGKATQGAGAHWAQAK